MTDVSTVTAMLYADWACAQRDMRSKGARAVCRGSSLFAMADGTIVLAVTPGSARHAPWRGRKITGYEWHDSARELNDSALAELLEAASETRIRASIYG